ncbi:response regulator transcription factor [Alkalibacterium kapii]|uniref:DNA-binding response regulator n=1 Tax=Alkalibacterium kapii TaxID=426704 RepID=A0A511ARZ7_9LACT|nr:response regulator [Alkalibacterium kapii]GEK90979.1 hypothetical protein AKA01nite_06010 [Alkalibacterium kapii]
MMYKVMLVDDWEIFRIQFNRKAHLDVQKDFELVYEAKNGLEALNYLKMHDVDCVVTDIRMPVMDGVEFLKETRLIDEELPVVFLSEYEDFHYAKAAITHRIVDYVVKPVSERDIDQLFSKLKKELDQKVVEKRETGAPYDDLIPQMVETITDIDKLKQLIDTYIKRVDAFDQLEPVVQYVSCLKVLDEALCQRYPWLKHYRLKAPADFMHQNYLEEKNSGQLFKIAVTGLSQIVSYLYCYSEKQPLIAKVSELILSDPRQRTIKSLAERLFMNKNYLSDVFKKETGETLNEYMKSVTITRVTVLAHTTDLKNYEIAETLGFQHADYFSRLFKIVTGETLSEHRKKENLDFV